MSEHEPALTAHTGYTAVMVVTHDCQMDKEAAVTLAENDPELDRFVTVVPLVPVDWLRTSEMHLLSGDTTGYFPVPAWAERGTIGGVADLTCPTTIDRSGPLTERHRQRQQSRFGPGVAGLRPRTSIHEITFSRVGSRGR